MHLLGERLSLIREFMAWWKYRRAMILWWKDMPVWPLYLDWHGMPTNQGRENWRIATERWMQRRPKKEAGD